MWIPLTVTFGGSRRDLHIEAASEAQVSDLEQALERHFASGRPVKLSSPRGLLASTTDLVSAGVRAGVVLDVRDDDLSTEPGRNLVRRQLRVVGGPDAGLAITLPDRGVLVIGRGTDADIRLSDPAVSQRHAVLNCTPEAVTVADTGSRNGIAVDNRKVTGPLMLNPSMLVQVGVHRLALYVRPVDPPATVRTTQLADGTVRVEREQLFLDPLRAAELSTPKPPDESARAPVSVNLATASGLIGGGIAYLLLHNTAFLVLSAASFIVGVVTNLFGVAKFRRTRSKSQRTYEQALVTHQQEKAAAAAAERVRRIGDAPDPAELVSIAETLHAGLWGRRISSEDFLRVRVGMADLASRLTIHHPDGRSAHETLLDVPLTIDWATVGTIGVTGSRIGGRALARWLVAQAAVQSGPTDLRVVVLTGAGDRDAQEAWDWVRWLPHSRADTGPLASVGGDGTSLTDQIGGLADLVTQRQQAARASIGVTPNTRAHRPVWLVVVDNIGEHDQPRLTEVLSRGPDVGVVVVAIGPTPERCPVKVEFIEDALLTVRQSGYDAIDHVLADQISPAVAERVGRALAPLSDPDRTATIIGLPSRVSLIDQITLHALDPAALIDSWRRTPRLTRVVVGQTAAGPLWVDVVANGPHALIAGATGSGKSAMLQSLVASLAIANRPDELGFILVDFKGGAAFAKFEGLPHIQGFISNLEGHSVMRALDSLSGDLERRQEYLRLAGAASLSAYHAMADEDALPASCPTRLPRVFIVIDEFAMLQEDVPPELLDGLVRVATVGRSLGVHLIIGTQFPRGIVPPNMRPNVNLKVAFRLDADHSQDVIGTADASRLAGSGRGYLRRGDEPDLTLFQASFVGGSSLRRPGAIVSVVEVPFARLGHAPAEGESSGVSDIDVIVRAVSQAAAVGQVPVVPPPWLPDLPLVLPMGDLDQPVVVPDVVLCYGQEDQPEKRAQPPAMWNLTRATHLLVAGRPRSGRSTVLRTLAASIARYRPDEIHLYVMDCGGGLADLANLPHCGAVVTRHEIERGARLLDRLDGVVTAYERSGAAGARPTRRTVLFIDDWEAWRDSFGDVDNGALLQRLVRLFRNGAAAGVHVVVTGGSALLTSGQTRPFTEAAQDRLVLPFDPEDYRWLGIPATAIPGTPHPGRAVRVGSPCRTVQIAVVGMEADSSAQVAALRAIAAATRVNTAHGGPPPVDALPGRIEVRELVGVARANTSAPWIPLGVGGDQMRLLGVSLDVDGPGVFVAGESRSGRSSALLAIGIDLINRAIPVVAVMPSRGSALRVLKEHLILLEPSEPSRRLMQLAMAAVEPPFIVLVDDVGQLARTDMAAELRELLVSPPEPWAGLVVAAGTDELANPSAGSLLAEVGRTGAGLLLNPRMRPQLFGTFVRIPPAYVETQPTPGRGVLITRSGVAAVQAPMPGMDDPVGLPPREPGLISLLERANAMVGPSASTVSDLREVIRKLRAGVLS